MFLALKEVYMTIFDPETFPGTKNNQRHFWKITKGYNNSQKHFWTGQK